LPLWLTLNFPNLCISPYIRTYTRGVAPARHLWSARFAPDCDTFYLIRASAWWNCASIL